MKTRADLDLETKSSYTVTVSVGDGKDSRGSADPAPDDRITVIITVTGVELTEQAKEYDRDENGLIGRDEAIAAVSDYFEDIIAWDEALAIVVFYFESPATGSGGPSSNGGDGP